MPLNFLIKNLKLINMDSAYNDNDIFEWEGRILVAANLPYNVTPVGLRDFFAPKGKILRVDIERNKQGESNGLGFVEFYSAADCAAAAELHGTQFEGRTLKCKVSTRPPPELLRFYIRDPKNRPINDRVRQNIIEEAKNGPIDHQPRNNRKTTRPRKFFKRVNKDQSNPDQENQNDTKSGEYSYSYSSGYSEYSYSDYDN